MNLFHERRNAPFVIEKGRSDICVLYVGCTFMALLQYCSQEIYSMAKQARHFKLNILIYICVWLSTQSEFAEENVILLLFFILFSAFQDVILNDQING